MKPLHSSLVRVSRTKCPCCNLNSKYCTKGRLTTNDGASAARQKVKRDIRKELREDKSE